MICPHCGHDNVPGSEECSNCLMDLTQLDRPMASNQIERVLMEDQVRVLEPKKPITVSPSTTVQATIQIMLARDIGALLVVNAENKLLGIFSERDLLTRIAGLNENYSNQPIERFMTSKPETVTAQDTLAFALHKMDVGEYRHLPVVEDGRPVGMISIRDVLRYITRLCK
jgi:CBS domain-containing protein